MKHIKITFLALFLGITSQAQVLHTADTSMEELFSADVSTMSEFRDRFNFATESKSINDAGQMKEILSLFNRRSESILSKQSIVISFAEDVLQNKQKLTFADSLWYADVLCSIKYKGHTYDIHLIMKTEQVDNDLYRWSFCGVDGLREAGIINNAEFGYIEPIDNELNFIDLDNRLQKDYRNAFGYKSSAVTINQLSVFLYLLQEHDLTIEFIDKIKYHFLVVPGYVFVVEQSGTPMNSGWLISDILTITNEGRDFYEKALCGDF